MDHPESASGEARAVPHFRDGQANGFKLVGVRRVGLLGQLGVRSGGARSSVGRCWRATSAPSLGTPSTTRNVLSASRTKRTATWKTRTT